MAQQKQWKCGTLACLKWVNISDKKVRCGNCKSHYHAACVDLENHIFVILAAEKIPGCSWSCPKCLKAKTVESKIAKARVRLAGVEENLSETQLLFEDQLVKKVEEIVKANSKEVYDKISNQFLLDVRSIETCLKAFTQNNENFNNIVVSDSPVTSDHDAGNTTARELTAEGNTPTLVDSTAVQKPVLTSSFTNYIDMVETDGKTRPVHQRSTAVRKRTPDKNSLAVPKKARQTFK